MPSLSTVLGLLLATWLITPGAAVAQAADEPGKAAFIAGDYQGAMAIWLPLAEAGDSHAQFNVGLLISLIFVYTDDHISA